MISVVGPAFWDVTIGVDKFPVEGELVQGHRLSEGPGGQAANTAAWLASHEISVCLFARSGSGENGRRLRETCSRLPLAMYLHPQWLPPRGDIGTCFILRSQSGERTIIWARDPGQSKLDGGVEQRLYVEEFTIQREALLSSSSVAWVQADGERRVEYWKRLAGAIRGLRVTDVKEEILAGRNWELLVGSLADAPLPTQEELRLLGCRLAVMTNGSRGCEYSYEGGKWQHQDVDPIEAVDTTGAGDAFLAGVLSGLQSGLPIGEEGLMVAKDAITLGSSYGSEAVAQIGSWPRYLL